MFVCSLTCPLPNTETVKLQFNRLVGTLPAEYFSGARDLQVFHIGFNGLTGHLPDVFDGEGNRMLEQLHLQGNHLSGSLPTTLGHLSHLQYLEIWNNDFSGTIPTQWGGMTQLEILRIVSYWLQIKI